MARLIFQQNVCVSATFYSVNGIKIVWIELYGKCFLFEPQSDEFINVKFNTQIQTYDINHAHAIRK